MELSKNAEFLLKDRYCRNNESIKDLFERVANGLSCGDSDLSYRLERAMAEGYFLPSSPIIRNVGMKRALLHACHVLPISDSIEDIMNCLSNSATVFHHGGGVGFNASSLRPKGDKLSLGGTSSGVVSFLKLFDDLTDVVKQGGFRRGALMGVLNHNHPEIASFITSKLTGSLTNFNISILVNDDFMTKATVNNKARIKLEFNNKTYENIRANDLFDQIVFSAYICGDPGLLFYDRINKDNKLWPKVKIEATNPCGEVPLPPMTSCNLGSINLTKFVRRSGVFDFNKYIKYVELGMTALKNVNKIAWYPFRDMTINMKKLDICGLGHLGLADALIMMGIHYGSKECMSFLDELSKPYVEVTDAVGGDSFYKRSQAPNGSTSIMADCSAGIEPVFDRNFTRHLTIGVISEVRELYTSEYCKTAHEIDPIDHLAVQAKIQSFTDAGVSKTINLPHDATLDDIRMIYIRAWKLGCKGITVFRDTSKEGVLRKVKCSDDTCYL